MRLRQFINEKVIKPKLDWVDDVFKQNKNIIKRCRAFAEEAKDNKSYINGFMDWLNELFKDEGVNIEFRIDRGRNLKDLYDKKNYIFSGGANFDVNTGTPWITINVHENIFRRFLNDESIKEFQKSLKLIIGHEMVHLMQMMKIEDPEIITGRSSVKALMKGGKKLYMAHPDELMAYAQEIVNRLMQKYNKVKILSILKSGDWSKEKTLEAYFSQFDKQKDKKTLNQLLKYMYEYLQ